MEHQRENYHKNGGPPDGVSPKVPTRSKLVPSRHQSYLSLCSGRLGIDCIKKSAIFDFWTSKWQKIKNQGVNVPEGYFAECRIAVNTEWLLNTG